MEYGYQVYFSIAATVRHGAFSVYNGIPLLQTGASVIVGVNPANVSLLEVMFPISSHLHPSLVGAMPWIGGDYCTNTKMNCT